MREVEMYKTWQGYEVRVKDKNRWLYVKNYYRSEYTFCTDYLYAKHFSKLAAQKHVERLKRG